MSNVPSNTEAAKSAGDRIREHTENAAKTMQAARAAGAASSFGGLGANAAGPMADVVGALQNLGAANGATDLIRSILSGAAQIKQKHPLDGGCQTETIVVKCLDILTMHFTQQISEVAELKTKLEVYRTKEIEQIAAAKKAEAIAELEHKAAMDRRDQAAKLIQYAVDVAKHKPSIELSMFAQYIAREAGVELTDETLFSISGEHETQKGE